jgi:hypothetical protein
MSSCSRRCGISEWGRRGVHSTRASSRGSHTNVFNAGASGPVPQMMSLKSNPSSRSLDAALTRMCLARDEDAQSGLRNTIHRRRVTTVVP